MNTSLLKSYKFWTVVVILVLAAAAFALFLTRPLGQNFFVQSNSNKSKTQTLMKGVIFSAQTPGKLPAGFPAELIPYPKVEPFQSDVNTTPDATHLAIQFVAPGSTADVFNQYKTALSAKGWTLLGSGANGDDFYVQLGKSGGVATVTIYSQPAGTVASVDYVPAK